MTLKRIFDTLFALFGLIILFPILIIIATLVFLKKGRPIFFCQIRPGLYGKPFRLIKFNTMIDIKDSRGRLLPDDIRMTSFGRYLRASSFDELPELWNVLKGDMSIVGPRPLLMEYLPLYSPEQLQRHGLRPGITGWAQVNGRNAISWEEKFKLDVWYVDHQSFWLDLKILWLTLIKVFKSEGINNSDGVPMPEFKGSDGVDA